MCDYAYYFKPPNSLMYKMHKDRSKPLQCRTGAESKWRVSQGSDSEEYRQSVIEDYVVLTKLAVLLYGFDLK